MLAFKGQNIQNVKFQTRKLIWQAYLYFSIAQCHVFLWLYTKSIGCVYVVYVLINTLVLDTWLICFLSCYWLWTVLITTSIVGSVLSGFFVVGMYNTLPCPVIEHTINIDVKYKANWITKIFYLQMNITLQKVYQKLSC